MKKNGFVNEYFNRCVRKLGTLPLLLTSLLTFFITPLQTQAVELEGLYQAAIEINSRNDETELQRAFSAAMSEVLIKVSGKDDLLSLPQISNAINSPQSYIESWLYRTLTLTPDESVEEDEANDIEIIMLEVSFYEPEIQALLTANSIALWPNNRQETLIWLVLQEELGERGIVASNGDGNLEVFEIVKNVAEQRGLPIILPLMDLADQFAIDADVLWELNEPAILAASARYQADSILALRIYRSLSGELLARSEYFFQGRAMPLRTFDDNLEGFLGTSLANVSAQLSSYYAVLRSGNDFENAEAVSLNVAGITSAKAYSDLLTYVSDLDVVSSYQITSIAPQNMILSLVTGSQLNLLIETLALDNKLQLVGSPRRNNRGTFIYYRWTD